MHNNGDLVKIDYYAGWYYSAKIDNETIIQLNVHDYSQKEHEFAIIITEFKNMNYILSPSTTGWIYNRRITSVNK